MGTEKEDIKEEFREAFPKGPHVVRMQMDVMHTYKKSCHQMSLDINRISWA